jgi:hypothetical protein
LNFIWLYAQFSAFLIIRDDLSFLDENEIIDQVMSKIIVLYVFIGIQQKE